MSVRSQVTVVVLVLGLFGLVDFLTRVYVPRSDAERNLQLETVPASGETLSLAEARQRLQSWLPDQQAAATAVQPGNQDDETNSELELPDRGRLAGRLYLLRGIFETENGPPFAVVEVTPGADGPIDRHDVSAGDDIGGVRVEAIDGRRVSLSNDGDLIQLSLFLDPGTETVAADKPND